MKEDTETTDLTVEIIAQHAEDLRAYIMLEWAGWVTALILISATGLILWRNRNPQGGDYIDWARIGATVCLISCLIIIPIFVPYTLRVLMTPELEALNSILTK